MPAPIGGFFNMEIGHSESVYEEQSNSEKRASDGAESERKRKRKSRWDTSDGKTFIPGMPTVLPTNLNKEQEEAYLLQLQIEEVSRKLRTGDLGIPDNPEERSPSPEPIYSFDGKRLNTREYRTRKRLEEERHALIGRMIKINPEFKPPLDYKPPQTRVHDKVMIPQDMHPDINFVGLLIGPRGNTLKSMESETGAKIIIRGKGSVKEGKVGRKDGQPLPGENEPLHAYVTANNPEYVKKAVDKIKEIIRQGVEVPEGQNDLRRQQLRELALLNGTLRENDGLRCTNCGATDHKSWTCPDKPNVTMNVICTVCGGAGHVSKDCRQRRPGAIYSAPVTAARNDKALDQEYLSLMAELGEKLPQQPPIYGDQNRSSGGLFDRTQQPKAIQPLMSIPPWNSTSDKPPQITGNSPSVKGMQWPPPPMPPYMGGPPGPNMQPPPWPPMWGSPTPVSTPRPSRPSLPSSILLPPPPPPPPPNE